MDEDYNRISSEILFAGIGYLRLIVNDRKEAEDYMFLDINPMFEKMTGLNRGEIVGKRASDVFRGAGEGSFDWLSYYESVVRLGKAQETIQRIEKFNRQYKVTVIPADHEVVMIVLQEAPDKPVFHWSEKETASALESLESVFDRTHDAILLVKIVNGEFRYVHNNLIHQMLTGFSNINGATPVELMGEEIGGKLMQYYEECIRDGISISYEQKYDFAPGKRVWHTNITPVKGRDGAKYLLCSSKDITDLKKAQGENEILTQRLHAMFYQHAAVMLIIEPISGKILDANPAASKFYGYSKEEFQNLLISDINMLNPEEVSRHRLSAYENAREYFLFPHRLKTGEIRLVDVYSCPISDGENALLYSIIFDATERETYRNELFQEKETLRTTLHSIGDGVVTTDSSGVITSLNLVAQEITGWKHDEAKGRIFTDVFSLQNEETGQAVESPIRKVLETGRIVGLANHTVLLNRQNQTIPIADSAAPIRAEDGETLGVVMVFRDVSLEKEQSEQIRFLSYHDPLTGLFNRGYIDEMLKWLDTENNLPISVVMGDVNGLKITNDVFGHRTGDELLKRMAGSLIKNCRKNDVIARWGGDEVVIFMPGTNLSEAEKIIRKIKNDSVDVEEGGLRMSVSFGCAVKYRPDESIQSVMREAEESMYHEKLLEGRSYRNALINTLLATLYEKSNETKAHSRRIEKHCHLVGSELRLSSKEMSDLSLLAILHDIGKVSVDPNILRKPSSLTPEEWEEMKRHTEIGYRIAQSTPELATVADLILSHHERWDGKGYPRGIKGAEIPLACRILAVADAFDAMTNDRVYRKAMSREEAVAELERNSSLQFDPEITELFIKLVARKGGPAQAHKGLPAN